MKCPRCQFENPDGFAYCGRCGAALRSVVPASEGERRFVTIMFADIANFTSFSERHDPEEVTAVVNRALQAMSEAVFSYGGTVDKYTGDGLMALFGAPTAHEDDPERAVRAALAMMETLPPASLAGDAQESAETWRLQLHIGIAAGEVVAGQIGAAARRDYTVIGDTVNLAARLEESSKAGQILVSEEAHRLTQALFEYGAALSLRVKGKRELVPAYPVLGVKTGAIKTRGIEGLRSPLVGRVKELTALQQSLRHLRVGQGQIVSLTGEAGLGKSRLLAELKLWVRNQKAKPPPRHRRRSRKSWMPSGTRSKRAPRVFSLSKLTWLEGHCLPYGRVTGYGVFVEIIKEALGIVEGDNEATAWAKLRATIAALADAKDGAGYRGLGVADLQAAVPYIANLLSLRLPDAEAQELEQLEAKTLEWQMFVAVRDFLVALTRREPLVVVFEDLHWADESSCHLLSFMLKAVERAPVLLCLVYRPDREADCWQIKQKATERWGTRHTEIELAPLAERESHQLVDNLMTITGTAAPAVRRLILARAEGNPFYIEEIMRALIERELLVPEDGHWRAARAGGELDIPDTLQGVIMARIDSLEEKTKRTLQLAAVIGRNFNRSLLRAIAATEIDEQLIHLQQLGLIYPRSYSGEREFSFGHGLTQEVIYNGLLRRSRRRLHAQVGQCIETLYSDRLDEHLELLAHHYAESDDRLKAIEYALKAGDKLRQLYLPRQATAFYTQGLETATALAPSPEVKQLQIELYQRRAGIWGWLAEHEKQLQDTETALALAQETGDRVREVRVLTQLGRNVAFLGDTHRSLALLQQALPIAQELGDCGSQATCLYSIGTVHAFRGEYTEAEKSYQQGMAIATETGLDNQLATGYINLGELYRVYGRYRAALEQYEGIYRIEQTLGARRMEAFFFLNSADVFQEMGELRTAWDRIQQAQQITQEINIVGLESAGLAVLAAIETRLGHYGQAAAHLARLVGMLQHTTFLEIRYYLHHAHNLYYEDLGIDCRAAWDWGERALALAQESRNAKIEVATRLSLGRLSLRVGRMDDAATQLRRTLEMATDKGFLYERGVALAEWGYLLARRGEVMAGERHAREALEVANQTESKLQEARARYRLGQIYLMQARHEEALEQGERALALASGMGYAELEWLTLRALGQAHEALNEREPARQRYTKAARLTERLAATITDGEMRGLYLQCHSGDAC